MAKPNKKRPIRMDQFVKQLEDSGINELEEIQVTKDDSVWIRLGVGVEVEKTMEFVERVQATDTAEEAALVILGEHPTFTAEEQRDKVIAAGWTDEQLVALWAAATSDMRDEMGKLRPKRS